MRKKEKFFITILALLAVVIFVFYCLRQDRQPASLGGPQLAVVNPQGEIEQVPLEDFLVQVVAAEMPVSFGQTALQAQAIAARTYIAAHMPPYGQGRHENAVVCCDSAHCQAYVSMAQMEKNWREHFWPNLEQVRQAVAATSGQVLLYQGKIAETPYFSCCGGRTESAADCWGSDRPYLRSNPCGYCVDSPKLINIQRLSVTEAATALSVPAYDLYDMYIAAYTAGGRVGQVMIGQHLYSGSQLRTAWKLSSTAFTWLIAGDNLVITNLGFGHGVGLCQYGAAGMAKAGADVQQILGQYYPGCEIGMLEQP